MTEQEVNELNAKLKNPIGHIYWVDGYNWDSKLWRHLWARGWTIKNNHGIVHIFDSSGKERVWAIGRANALYELGLLLDKGEITLT